MGIDCPGEISVVGFGDESWSELTYPPLTIIRRDVKGLSTKAVGMLLRRSTQVRSYPMTAMPMWNWLSGNPPRCWIMDHLEIRQLPLIPWC